VTKMAREIAQTDLVNNFVQPVPQNVGWCCHRCSMDIHFHVIVELKRRVPPEKEAGGYFAFLSRAGGNSEFRTG
jgi:hypothetical protein